MTKPKYMITRPQRKGKKYSVLKYDEKKKLWKYLLSFGDVNYQQFKDRTPFKLYSHLDHNDPIRREMYYKRHGPSNDPESSKFWSHRYLW